MTMLMVSKAAGAPAMAADLAQTTTSKVTPAVSVI